jgi:hypothetical protein
MSVEQLVEGELTGETQELGENLSQFHFSLPQIPYELTWDSHWSLYALAANPFTRLHHSARQFFTSLK